MNPARTRLRVLQLITAGTLLCASTVQAQAAGVSRLTSAGALDSSFSGDGMLPLDIAGCDDDVIEGIATFGTSFVAVGNACGQAFVTMLTPSGAIDSAFGIRFIPDFEASSVAVTNELNRRIIIAGGTPSIWDRDAQFMAVRLTSTGSFDASFGIGGITTLSFGSAQQGALAVAVQSDNKVVLAGYAGSNFAVARLLSFGVLDPAFQSGRIDFSTLASETARGVAIATDGKIVLGGYGAPSGSGECFASARVNTNGTLDTSYNFDGKALANFTSSTREFGVALALDSSNRVLLGGIITSASLGIVRWTVSGDLDTSFDGDGKVLTPFSNMHVSAHALAIRDGKIIAAGPGSLDSNGQQRMIVARYNSNGTLDTTFSSDGKVTIDFPGFTGESVQSVATSTGSSIVLAGGL